LKSKTTIFWSSATERSFCPAAVKSFWNRLMAVGAVSSSIIKAVLSTGVAAGGATVEALDATATLEIDCEGCTGLGRAWAAPKARAAMSTLVIMEDIIVAGV
jgi:hypothetical protein